MFDYVEAHLVCLIQLGLSNGRVDVDDQPQNDYQPGVDGTEASHRCLEGAFSVEGQVYWS